MSEIIIVTNGERTDRLSGGAVFNNEAFDEKATLSKIIADKRLGYSPTSASIADFEAEEKAVAAEIDAAQAKLDAYYESEEGKFEMAFAENEKALVAERKSAFRESYFSKPMQVRNTYGREG